MTQNRTTLYDISSSDDDGDSTVALSNTELTKRIREVEQTVEELTIALNESRDRIQALMDFCFADKSAWKEGQSATQGPKVTK